MKDKLDLLKRIRSYLPNHSGVGATTTVYISPAQSLRNQADSMEQQERDAFEFDELIKELEKIQ